MDFPRAMATFKGTRESMSRVTDSLDNGRVSFGDREEIELASAVDPVCGREIKRAEAAGAIDYHGTVYFFCSVECKAAFEAEPRQYALVPSAPLSQP
jgi:YHS domain-containing protein